MEKKKIIASFELVLMMVSMFAFSHGIYLTSGGFEESILEYEKARLDKIAELDDIPPRASAMSVILDILFEKIKSPMIPIVSAVRYCEDEDDVRCLIGNESRTTYSISSSATDVGCCFISKDGQKCGTASPNNCVSDSPFAEGALCSQTSFCQKGCCYNEITGIYDKNVLKADCSVSWVADPNCNMPEAKLGCCILGTSSIYETLGQCQVDTLARAIGDSAVVNWDGNTNEGQCLMLSATQKEGACVLAGEVCKFGSEHDCYTYDGNFNEGYLCTSSLLNTSCEMTERTTCVEGKDGVYFVDSCGNYANIYDSTRVNDQSYWNMVAVPENICGDENVEGGNANSTSCGNCNRFMGGICGSAVEDNFDVDIGNFYCKDTSCVFNGERYKNGESWCVYDGAIGNGDDVVGSRHWKYVCSQGKVEIEPCADYRNQICIQTNTFDVDGTEVQFRNSACIANNWRKCIDLNSEDSGFEECADTLNCRVENIEIASHFKFDVCLPKYPGGFSLKNERYMSTAEKICGMADQTCTVVYAPKRWGGCEIATNAGCFSEKFAQEMNDFCRGLGDCGGAVNIEGAYSDNYKVERSPELSQNWIDKLKALAESVPGQFAEVEDYTEFLETAGIWANPGENPEAGEEDEGFDYNTIGAGAAGIGYVVSIFATGSLTFSGLALTTAGTSAGGFMGTSAAVGGVGASGATAGMAGFCGMAIGAGIGFIAGSMLAKQLGLSPGGAMLMAIGCAMLGAALGIWMTVGFVNCWNPIGWALIIIGIILIVISLMFGGDDCPPVEVTFECKPWKAPVGGDDCEICNGDPLKPCSEYRCNSLGAACELVNKGTEEEMCASSRDDGNPPILSPQIGVISDDVIYGDISDNGFSLTSTYGSCIDAYTPLMFGINTDELSYCKFDTEITEFENMNYDLGGNAYLYNHTTIFSLPDPSHGQSQGANWTGDLTLYIKCVDTHGHESPSYYEVDMCVKEGDDKTGPIIRATEPVNDAIVGFEISSKNVSIITNEFATCKWDSANVDYFLMGNSMECDDVFGMPSSPLGYQCNDEFSVANATNVYYVRCADQPWLNDSSERNSNAESFVYTLRKPEKKIEIDWVEPEGDFETNTVMTTVDLEVRTSGGGEWHWCSYSFSGYDKMIEMFETGAEKTHSQLLNRPAGDDKIYVECKDETGDSVQSSTEFNIIRDTSTPQVARIWQSGGRLYIITTENAECLYSTVNCNFNWDDGESAGSGEEHIINVVRGGTYYIKCKDEFGNTPTGCSVETRVL